MQRVEQIQHVGAPGDGVVLLPLELRRVAELQGGPQLPAEVAACGAEPLQSVSPLALVQGTDVNLGIAQVRRSLHPGDGYHGGLHPGVLQVAKQACQLPLDFLIDAADSIGCHWHVLL